MKGRSDASGSIMLRTTGTGKAISPTANGKMKRRESFRMTMEMLRTDARQSLQVDALLEAETSGGPPVTAEEITEFYEQNPPPNAVARRDLAHIHQRQGAVLLKTGQKDSAARAFERALEVLEGTDQTLPLARTS